MVNICINDVKINETGISYRTFSVLNRAGLHTVGEVTELTDKQLLEIRNLGIGCLGEIKREIFDSERVLDRVNKNIISLNTDDIFEVKEFSIRIINALYRADIKAVSDLKKTTDIQLSRIRNLGAKSIAEIDAIIPDRIRTFESETEELEAQCKKNKIERAAKRIMRYMEEDNETLSQLTERGFRYLGNKKARRVMTDYCATFPERINEVLEHFEAVNDTSDILYKQLKQAHSLKISV